MLAGCRRAAEAASDAGERPRGSASASAVLPSAGGVGCEIAEPLVDPFGSFAGARFRRRRPRMIMWCPQQSRTTYSPPGRGRSSLFLPVSRGTWKSPSRLPSPPCRRSRLHWHHVLAAEGCRPPQGTLRDNHPCPVKVVSETTNLAVSRGTSAPPRMLGIWPVSNDTWQRQPPTWGPAAARSCAPVARPWPLARPKLEQWALDRDPRPARIPSGYGGRLVNDPVPEPTEPDHSRPGQPQPGQTRGRPAIVVGGPIRWLGDHQPAVEG